MTAARRYTKRFRGWRIRIPAAGWKRALLAMLLIPIVVGTGVLGYYYVQFSRIIDARLHGERDRVIPRVYARPLILHGGQGLSDIELIARLNDVGYTEKSRVERAGEFALERNAILVVPRGGDHAGKPVRIAFAEPRIVKTGQAAASAAPARIAKLEAAGSTPAHRPRHGIAREAAARSDREYSGAHAAGRAGD